MVLGVTLDLGQAALGAIILAAAGVTWLIFGRKKNDSAPTRIGRV